MRIQVKIQIISLKYYMGRLYFYLSTGLSSLLPAASQYWQQCQIKLAAEISTMAQLMMNKLIEKIPIFFVDVKLKLSGVSCTNLMCAKVLTKENYFNKSFPNFHENGHEENTCSLTFKWTPIMLINNVMVYRYMHHDVSHACQ